jgi:hypothetical protein
MMSLGARLILSAGASDGIRSLDYRLRIDCSLTIRGGFTAVVLPLFEIPTMKRADLQSMREGTIAAPNA